jgi:hypothetical protein
MNTPQTQSEVVVNPNPSNVASHPDSSLRQGGEDVAPTIDQAAMEPPFATRCEWGPLQEHAQSEHVSGRSAVAEAKRYRKRAQAAEKILEDLKKALAAREKTIAQQEQTIKSLERRQQIDELLHDAQTIDLESARLLTELSLAAMDEPDVESAVEELRRTKPHLFRSQSRRGTSGAGVMSARGESELSGHDDSVNRAAAEAFSSGKRSDLLRYLRLRRRN